MNPTRHNRNGAQPTQQLRDLLAGFLEYRSAINNSPYSIRNLKYNLLRFLTWLDQNKGVDTLQGLRYAHGSAWLTHLTAYCTSKGKPLHPRSINKQVECIRCFLEYLYRQGLVRPQLLQAFEYVKQPRVLPNSILTHAEMRALLESIPTDTSEGYRDRTLFELLYSSGIRAGEILGIQLTDLDLENQTVLVTGKGNKQRVVPIGNTATLFLTSYLAAVRPALEYNPQQQALFLDDTGQKMPYHTLRRILNHYTENAHLQTRVTLHTFRRSCTTEMVRAGANLYHIKEMLGHETLDTLKHYTKLTIVDLKKTHHQCHPREKENEQE